MKLRPLKLLFFLLLGAIVSVSVAWLISYSALRNGSSAVFASQVDKERVWANYSLPNWPSIMSGPQMRDLQDSDEWETLGAAYEWNQFGVKRFVCHFIDSRHFTFDYRIVCEVQAGWPARCVRGGVRYLDSTLETESVNALLLPESEMVIANIKQTLGPFPTGRIFVYRPIWLGLILNSIFYALILYAILKGLNKIHFYIRKLQNKCAKCGYDLRGCTQSGCPECGWGREAEG